MLNSSITIKYCVIVKMTPYFTSVRDCVQNVLVLSKSNIEPSEEGREITAHT